METAEGELYRIIRVAVKTAKNWKFQGSRPMSAETGPEGPG